MLRLFHPLWCAVACLTGSIFGEVGFVFARSLFFGRRGVWTLGKAPHERKQILNLEGFWQVRCCPCKSRFKPCNRIIQPGNDNDRDVHGCRMLLKTLCDLVSTERGHTEVDEEEIGQRGLACDQKSTDCRYRILKTLHLMAFFC